MNVVWKYPLDEPVTEVEMPAGATILSVQTQYVGQPHEQPVLWAQGDPDEPKVPRRFVIVGTGHPFNGSHRIHYLGTFQLLAGAFVGHVYEVELA